MSTELDTSEGNRLDIEAYNSLVFLVNCFNICQFKDSPQMKALLDSLMEADKLIEAVGTTVPKGYIILKETNKKNEDGSNIELYVRVGYHASSGKSTN